MLPANQYSGALVQSNSS